MKYRLGDLARVAAVMTELEFDPARAVVIGDRPSAVEFGHRVGALTMLIAQERLDADASSRPKHVVRDLRGAAGVLLALQLTVPRARVDRCT